jgi:preprotein translocase subunit SecB
MKTPPQPLRASPLQIEKHEFLDIEVHAADSDDAHTSLPLEINRNFARHDTDPLRWRVELTVRFGGETDGKPSVYSGRLRIAGYFLVHEKYPAQKIKELIEVTGASILYGACREMLANLTARGSHGVVSLPSVSFVAPRKESESTALRLAEDAPSYRAGRGRIKKRLTK